MRRAAVNAARARMVLATLRARGADACPSRRAGLAPVEGGPVEQPIAPGAEPPPHAEPHPWPEGALMRCAPRRWS